MVRWLACLSFIGLVGCAFELPPAQVCGDLLCPSNFDCIQDLCVPRQEVDGGHDVPDDGGTADAMPVDGPPGCGNGTITPPEQCDDLDHDDHDSCTNACRLARCGDGVIRTGVETCETPGDLQCSPTCRLCPEGSFWLQSTGHCYRSLGGKSWTAAQAGCNTYEHLVHISTSAEGVELAQLIGTQFWTGHYTADGTNWITDDDAYSDPFDPFFDTGEPAGNNQNCGLAAPGTGLISSENCSDIHTAICEDDGWYIHGPTLHAYRVINEPVRGDMAAIVCEREGAHLFRSDFGEDQELFALFGMPNRTTLGAWIDPESFPCQFISFPGPFNLNLTQGASCAATLPGVVCEID